MDSSKIINSKNITCVKLPDIGSPILITLIGNDSPEANATKPCESSSVPGLVGVADPEPDRLPPEIRNYNCNQIKLLLIFTR